MILKKIKHIIILSFGSFIIPLSSYCQEHKNQNVVDSLLTFISERDIEKNIIGTWKYSHSEDLTGNRISKIFHEEQDFTETLSGFILIFSEDKKYEKFLISTPNKTESKGKWEFDEIKKYLYLVFDKPSYQPSIENIVPSFLEEYKKMVEKGQIPFITKESIQIEKINNTELILLGTSFDGDNLIIYRSIYKKSN